MMESLPEESFKAWLESPVTKALHHLLRARRLELMEQWASGGFMIEENFATALVNARAVAECAAYQDVLDMDLEQLKEISHE